MRERERKREGGFKKDLLIKQKTYNKKQGLKDPKHTYHSHRLVNKFSIFFFLLSSLFKSQLTTTGLHISLSSCVLPSTFEKNQTMKLLLVPVLLFLLFLSKPIWVGATQQPLVPVSSPLVSPTSPISTSMAAFSPGPFSLCSSWPCLVLVRWVMGQNHFQNLKFKIFDNQKLISIFNTVTMKIYFC